MLTYCQYFSWALLYPLVEDKFVSLYSVPYIFFSLHNTCIGQHSAHSRHWQIAMHDAEVDISRTLNCIKFTFFWKKQNQKKKLLCKLYKSLKTETKQRNKINHSWNPAMYPNWDPLWRMLTFSNFDTHEYSWGNRAPIPQYILSLGV